MNEIMRTTTMPIAMQMDPMTVAQVFKASGMFPDIQSEAAACAKIIIGRGLGLTDYDAMTGLHIIKGKAVLASNLMAAAIKRAGKYDYRAECTEEECTIVFYGRTMDGKMEKIGTTSYTMEDAKRARLTGGDNWQKYPRAMLFARCISTGYKQHCPDALGSAPVYVEAHGDPGRCARPDQGGADRPRRHRGAEGQEDFRKAIFPHGCFRMGRMWTEGGNPAWDAYPRSVVAPG